MDDSTPEVRIGDRERREVDARLQQAYADGVLTLSEYEERSQQCWGARTRSELEPLVRDLPAQYRDEPEPERAPAPAPALPAKKAAAPPEKRKNNVVGGLIGVGLLGVAVFAGSQVVTADDGAAIFGSRVVNAAPGDDRVDVGMAFGSVRVVVPADARVQTEGVVIFGGLRCQEACDGSGARDVVVDASGAFGSVTVHRVGGPIPSGDNDNDDRGDDDGDNDGDNDGDTDGDSGDDD